MVGIPPDASGKVEHNAIDEWVNCRDLIRKVFRRMIVAGVNGNAEIVLCCIGEIKVVGTNSKAFIGDGKNLTFHAVSQIPVVQLLRENPVQRIHQPKAVAISVGSIILYAVRRPDIMENGTGSSRPMASQIRRPPIPALIQYSRTSSSGEASEQPSFIMGWVKKETFRSTPM